MREPIPYEYTGQKRLYVVLAVFWMMVGLSLLSYAGYNYFRGTSSGAEQLVYVRPIVATPTPAVAGAALGPVSPLVGQNFQLLIDKIGVKAPVAPFGLDADGVPQVPYEGGLVAWYNFSAVPGSGSNAVFAGHVTWYGDAVFRHLEDLAPGDKVTVQGANGAQLIYEVTVNTVVKPTVEAVREWLDGTDRDVITLVTCAGTFTWTGDPLTGGVYDQRQVVRAELVGQGQAAAPPAGG